MKTEMRYDGYLAMAGPVKIRPPALEDAAAIQALVQKSPPLDTNSCYAYLLQAWHFSDTCVLAEMSGTPVAYISAYRPPRQPETLFLWQVVVASEYRGLGLARSLVHELLLRPSCRAIRFISATVSDGNVESEQFFSGLAKELRCQLGITMRLSASLFVPGRHAGERLFQLGPIKRDLTGQDWLEADYEPECV